MGTFGDLGDLKLVATWGFAPFCGPCPVDGVRAQEVARVGNWTPSAIPLGEEVLSRIRSTISRTDRFLRCEAPNRDETLSPCYHDTRPVGQKQRLQWHEQQRCLAKKT